MKYLFTCLLLLCPMTVAAQSSPPASVADCERLKNDLAYNQCLASFGPKRGERSARDVEDQSAIVQGSERRGRRAGRAGRQAASFDVVSGRGGARGPR